MVCLLQSLLIMPDIKAIIFDFDGVILDSVDAKTQAFAELYEPYGKTVVQQVVKHHEANGGISRFEKIRYYHSNFLGTELSEIEIDNIADQFSQLALNKVLSSPYVPGAEAFIKKNYKYDLFISTGTPKEEIEYILQKLKIREYFKKVYGSPAVKTEHVGDIIARNKYDNKTVIFVGDAATDVEAANANDIMFIGRNTTYPDILKEKYIIDNFYDLAKLLDN